ncbi:MAG: serine/threonine-protein phosphatase [Lachnoanaerobaculum sp.]|uniref:PP2C family protein-serine/threonine phosphatase n=1 Tax=Lachnoanaerobaculum sp. TaxID=2049030 RepID=UPI0025BD6193|nr:protein phosphatase 2C domain-containing protein [Lachnoanaerobaculum sp.]MBS5881460.1 serine/threonine-protein phosphatase [Lachnoanaerobaculum sp.]
MKYFLAAQTEVGLKKSCNQDSVILKRAKFKGKEVCLGIICDGMGGLSCGEFASKSIVEAFSDWFLYSYSKYESIWDESRMREDIGRIISSENEGLLHYGKEHGIYLGTTVTAFLLAENRFFVWHVGDSRLYKISSSKIFKLTDDHTVIAKEIAEGRLTEKEAKKDPRRNVLLQCIGATSDVNPDMFCGEVEKGDILLLCSDGFRHEVSEKEILNMLLKCDNSKFNEKLRALIDLNLKRKELDNISVALVKVQ